MSVSTLRFANVWSEMKHMYTSNFHPLEVVGYNFM